MREIEIISSFNRDKHYILIKVRGAYDPDKSELLTEESIRCIHLYDCLNIIYDFSDGDYIPRIEGASERISLLDEKGMPKGTKLAALIKRNDEKLKFYKILFLNRGYSLEFFKSISEAENWIFDQI